MSGLVCCHIVFGAILSFSFMIWSSRHDQAMYSFAFSSHSRNLYCKYCRFPHDKTLSKCGDCYSEKLFSNCLHTAVILTLNSLWTRWKESSCVWPHSNQTWEPLACPITSQQTWIFWIVMPARHHPPVSLQHMSHDTSSNICHMTLLMCHMTLLMCHMTLLMCHMTLLMWRPHFQFVEKEHKGRLK